MDQGTPHDLAATPENWKTLRDLWHRENDLIHQRLTWMVTFHSLLLSAVAFAWRIDGKLVLGFALSGFAVSISTFIGVRLAMRSLDTLGSWWTAHGPPKGSTVPLFHEAPSWQWILLPWNFWPRATAIGWVAVAAYRFSQPLPYEAPLPPPAVQQSSPAAIVRSMGAGRAATGAASSSSAPT